MSLSMSLSRAINKTKLVVAQNIKSLSKTLIGLRVSEKFQNAEHRGAQARLDFDVLLDVTRRRTCRVGTPVTALICRLWRCSSHALHRVFHL